MPWSKFRRTIGTHRYCKEISRVINIIGASIKRSHCIITVRIGNPVCYPHTQTINTQLIIRDINGRHTIRFGNTQLKRRSTYHVQMMHISYLPIESYRILISIYRTLIMRHTAPLSFCIAIIIRTSIYCIAVIKILRRLFSVIYCPPHIYRQITGRFVLHICCYPQIVSDLFSKLVRIGKYRIDTKIIIRIHVIVHQ